MLPGSDLDFEAEGKPMTRGSDGPSKYPLSRGNSQADSGVKAQKDVRVKRRRPEGLPPKSGQVLKQREHNQDLVPLAQPSAFTNEPPRAIQQPSPHFYDGNQPESQTSPDPFIDNIRAKLDMLEQM